MALNQTLAAKQQKLEKLRRQVLDLEQEIADELFGKGWKPSGFYTAYYATTGFILGLFGAAASLVFNVVGATVAGKNPHELIRIYLMFPLGETALRSTEAGQQVTQIDDVMVFALGVALYLGTGMLLGVPMYLLLSRFTHGMGMFARLICATVFALGICIVNFYGILSWVQPARLDGNWMTNSDYLPWWVAGATHLVFGWTLALVYPLGQYTPYQRPTEQ